MDFFVLRLAFSHLLHFRHELSVPFWAIFALKIAFEVIYFTTFRKSNDIPHAKHFPDLDKVKKSNWLANVHSV
jgi:hypothetical protein